MTFASDTSGRPDPRSGEPRDAASHGVPTFAVVGHPNKGKSSIVATLARDDSVAIAPEPGTTVKARHYPMRVDDTVLYVLIDTPGFQRARRALQWMRDHETTADKHREVVRQFVEAHRGTDAFVDEVELLAPMVLEDAGILYVVDGSKPYGPEYEAEMEILRWTGQPSMALINPIGEASHVDEWQAALGQYFRIVRVFDAVTAEFDKRLELLRAFGQLKEGWRAPLDEAVQVLLEDRDRRRQRAAHAIGDMLARMVSASVSRKLGQDQDPARYRKDLEQQYRDRLREIEQDGRRSVEEVYEHFTLQRRESALDVLDEDLFSQRSWLVMGLRRGDLVALGAAGGAAGGLALDVVAGGTTLGAGTAVGVIGGAIGGAMGWFSAGRLAEVKVLKRPLGGKLLQCGPSKHVNFPFVVLGRARQHHALVAGRTHAQRGELVIGDETSGKAGSANPLTDGQRRRLQRLFTRLRKNADSLDVRAEATDDLAQVVAEVLEGDEAADGSGSDTG